MKRNKISFGNSQTVLFEKEIEGEEHQNAVWYSQKEMKSIRKDLKKEIRKGEITRGLEQYEGDMGAKNKQDRLNHIRKILELQEQQDRNGVRDDKSFSLLSRSMSADNMKKAQMLASRDSSDALAEYKNLKSPFLNKNKNHDLVKQTAGLSLSRKNRKSTPNMFLTAMQDGGKMPLPSARTRRKKKEKESQAA